MNFYKWRNWLHRVTGARTRRVGGRWPLRVEQLEDRRLLTAAIATLNGAAIAFPPDVNFISFPPQSFGVMLQGTANQGATVTISVDGTDLSPTTTAFGPGGLWFYTIPVVDLTPDGDYTIAALDSDPLGSQGEFILVVDNVENAPSAPAFVAGQETGPAGSGLTQINQPGLTGTCDAAPHGHTTIDIVDQGTGATVASTTANTDGTWSVGAADYGSNTLADGVHQLLAKATDGAGNTATSTTSLTVTIDTQPPAASNNLSLDGSTDSGLVGDNLTNFTHPQIDGNAEIGSSVQLFVNGSPVAPTATADAGGNWHITTTSALVDGTYVVTARATDPAGNIGSASTGLTITIDTTPPAAPNNLGIDVTTNSGVQGDDITNFIQPKIDGNAEAGSSVTLKEGNNVLGTATATGGSWSISLNTTLGEGVHTLTAIATDLAGNPSTEATLTITIDTTPPAAPTNLALDVATDSGVVGDNLTNSTQPQIDGHAEAASTVTLLEGTTVLGTDTATPAGDWNITVSVSLGDGPHTFTAKATDVAGNTGFASGPLTVIIDTTPPPAPAALALDPSTDSGTIGDLLTNVTQPKVSGTAEAGSTITLREGTTVLGTGTASPAGLWTIKVGVSLGDGPHTFTAKATDVAGNTGTASTPLTISIDTVSPPAPANLALAPGSDDGLSASDNITSQRVLTLTGIATAGSKVTVFDGATPLGSTMTGNSGAWSFTMPALPDGDHAFRAQAADAAGNTSASSGVLGVTVDGTGVKANPLADFTARVRVTAAKIKKPGKRIRQKITLTNIGTIAILGPVRLVLAGLNKKIKVVGSSAAKGGDPFVVVPSGGIFQPGVTLGFTLVLSNPKLKKVAYTPKVFGGFGTL